MSFVLLAAAPMATAGALDGEEPVDCSILPLVDFVFCVKESVQEEIDYQVSEVNAAVAFYGPKATQAVTATTDFGGRQVTLTTVLVGDVQDPVYGFVTYVGGLPAVVTAYAGGAVAGECKFLRDNPNCGLYIQTGGSSLTGENACDPTGDKVAYVLCEANDAYAKVVVLANIVKDHYTATALSAVGFVFQVEYGAEMATWALVNGETTLLLSYSTDSGQNAKDYREDLKPVTSGAVPYATALAGRECVRYVWSGCASILGSLEFEMDG